MSIDASFVTEIRRPTEAKLLEVREGDESRVFSNVKLENLPPPTQHTFPTIDLCSLDSLVDYVAANRDYVVSKDECQIICRHDLVKLVGSPTGELRLRDTLVRVAVEPLKHKFDEWLSRDDFRIYLLTHFGEQLSDREMVIEFMSSVKDEHISTSTDDGITQTATVKAGLATLTTAKVPSPIKLRPIRTFTEIPQPDCLFIFRMQRNDKTGIQCALYEIQSNWKYRAAMAAKEFLEDRAELNGFTILA